MKKHFFFLPWLMFSGAIFAQNLVPNPSFEVNNACPNQINQVNKADFWDTWATTPDYFHICANTSSPLYGVPNNTRGFQVPHTGDAYIGLFTFSDLNANMREFVGCALTQPLTIGQQYFVSFWVCSVEQPLGTHSSDKIGIKFTNTPHSMFNPDTALNFAHVFSSTVINDSINWTLVQGSFIADSAYTHMGLGNYFDDANTTLITGAPTSNYAYYLVDDICVSPDPVFCNTETAILEYPNEQQLTVSPNPTTGIIYLRTMTDLSIRQLVILDIRGKVVFECPGEMQQQMMDVTFLADGVYLLRYESDGQSLYTKFLKQ